MPTQTAEDAMHPSDALPAGWFMAGSQPKDYEAGVTPDAFDGRAAAYLRARVASTGFGTIMQQFKADVYRGQRLRLSALVRSEDVERWAGLWMRVDGAARASIAFDNMHDRAITGTTDWTRHAVVLDVAERESTKIAFGVLLNGSGKLWIADVRIESVGQDVPRPARAFCWTTPSTSTSVSRAPDSELSTRQPPSLEARDRGALDGSIVERHRVPVD